VHDVPTKFGAVRLYQHGPDRGVPVVLIHGFFLTSAMWWGQVEGLTSDFADYAMDMFAARFAIRTAMQPRQLVSSEGRAAQQNQLRPH
jgi:pimeloyl-ACP methyl ester carboxylesterase